MAEGPPKYGSDVNTSRSTLFRMVFQNRQESMFEDFRFIDLLKSMFLRVFLCF